jgi:hypothetical protein
MEQVLNFHEAFISLKFSDSYNNYYYYYVYYTIFRLFGFMINIQANILRTRRFESKASSRNVVFISLLYDMIYI